MSSFGSTTAATPASSSPTRYDAQPRHVAVGDRDDRPAADARVGQDRRVVDDVYACARSPAVDALEHAGDLRRGVLDPLAHLVDAVLHVLVVARRAARRGRAEA